MLPGPVVFLVFFCAIKPSVIKINNEARHYINGWQGMAFLFNDIYIIYPSLTQ